MLVVFVHGWSVRHADYGALPSRLKQFSDTVDVRLSDYISYSDQVTMDDLVQAFERARLAQFPDQEFACVTHSTGGPVLRTWLTRHYAGDAAGRCPLTHLIMLAPPNHGSALAQLGRSRLSRMKFWLQGCEPGVKILDALELGSDANWQLNLASLQIDWAARGVYLFVLAGSAIDSAFYDHLNSYTGERGSDGVVRVASANLNFSSLRLEQSEAALVVKNVARSPEAATIILPEQSHCGSAKGILAGIPPVAGSPVVRWVERCLKVATPDGYGEVVAESEKTHEGVHSPCSMIAFRVIDSRGMPLEDYDLLLTGGPDYSPDELPKGFFMDRQRNQRLPHVLTYYLDHTAMSRSPQLGFRLIPRPDSGPVQFACAEFKGDLATVEAVLGPHQTALVEIVLERRLEPSVFKISEMEPPSHP
ncbi:MAG: hypothetical protein ABI824_05195 [Acidobacteriota bacterium]